MADTIKVDEEITVINTMVYAVMRQLSAFHRYMPDMYMPDGPEEFDVRILNRIMRLERDLKDWLIAHSRQKEEGIDPEEAKPMPGPPGAYFERQAVPAPPTLREQLDSRDATATSGAFGHPNTCVFPPPGPVDPELARLLKEANKQAEGRIVGAEPLESAPEKKRIFVVLAEYANGPEGPFKQPEGRLGAQIGHVVSKMRWSEGCRRLRGYLHRGSTRTLEEELHLPLKPITTINLVARNQEELFHIVHLLNKAGLTHMGFVDQNPEYLGGNYLTAICTEPIEKSKLGGITDYLPLWTPEETQ